MPSHDPWEGIEPDVPAGQLRARRVDSSHPYAFFWAKDANGHRLLVYQSKSLDADRLYPRLRGIAVEVADGRLLMRLLDGSDLEIFTTLCWSLIERTRNVAPESLVVDAIIAHLERWQRFVGKADSGLLSEQRIRGLLGELAFLEAELMSRFGMEAVSFWHGPAGHPQDFAIGTTVFEVKTRLAGTEPVIMISSANQLWHEGGKLYLNVYTLGEASVHTSEAVSLSSLVARIRGALSGSKFLDQFEDRLMQVGYLDHPEYGRRFFSISTPNSFEVGEEFPRMTAVSIPQGVCRVTYGIELAACQSFAAIPDWTGMGAANGA